MAGPYGKHLKRVVDPTLARAFTHPLRGHVWATLCEKGVASPKQIAAEIGIEVSEVSYHFRALHRRRLIELVRIERTRGVPEHFYEPTVPVFYFDQIEWTQIPEPVRARLDGSKVREIVEEVVSALEGAPVDPRWIPISVAIAAFEAVADLTPEPGG